MPRDTNRPDPFQDHDPSREPYASMTLEEISALMENAPPGEWSMLNEFLLDKMTSAQLAIHNHATAIATFLVQEYGANGNDQCGYLCELAGRMAAEIAENMPPIGPPEQCN